MSDNVDHLSNCAALPRILAFLPRQALFKSLTVNKKIYQEIARNGRTLWGVHLYVDHGVAEPPPYENPNSKVLLLKISDNSIKSLLENFPLFIRNAITPHGHEVNLSPMDSIEIPSRLEGAKIVFEAVLGYLQLQGLHIQDSGSGMYDAALALILKGCQKFYIGRSETVDIWCNDTQFRPLFAEINKAFGTVTYQIENEVPWHASLLGLPAEPFKVTLVNYTWDVADMHQFIEAWKSDERQIDFVDAGDSNVTPQMIDQLANRLQKGVNRSVQDIEGVVTIVMGFGVTRDVDGKVLLISLHPAESVFSLRIVDEPVH